VAEGGHGECVALRAESGEGLLHAHTRDIKVEKTTTVTSRDQKP
jgi:hypothetical protein